MSRGALERHINGPSGCASQISNIKSQSTDDNGKNNENMRTPKPDSLIESELVSSVTESPTRSPEPAYDFGTDRPHSDVTYFQ